MILPALDRGLHEADTGSSIRDGRIIPPLLWGAAGQALPYILQEGMINIGKGIGNSLRMSCRKMIPLRCQTLYIFCSSVVDLYRPPDLGKP